MDRKNDNACARAQQRVDDLLTRLRAERKSLRIMRLRARLVQEESHLAFLSDKLARREAVPRAER